MLLVNLYGAPGAGKTTGAAYIFSQLKMANINAELITEYAKDKVWEESKAVFQNQAYIFGKQYFRISRLQDKVDVAITDSPLLLTIMYNKDKVLGENFNKTVADVANSYDSMNYFIIRRKEYNPIGRFQTESESDAMVEPLKKLLDNYGVNYKVTYGCIEDYIRIINEILERIKK